MGGYQEQQNRCSFPFNHSDALGGEALWRTGDACWGGESGTKQQVLGGRLGGIRVGFIKDRRWGSRKDCQGCSTAELEKKKPGDWIWEKSERRENLQAAYLVFWQVYPVGKQRVTARNGDLEKATNLGRMRLEREELCDPLKRGVRH